MIVVQKFAKIPDDLSSPNEGGSSRIVHDQVQISLSISLLLVLEAEVCGRQLMEAGGEKDDFAGEDTQFTGAAALGLCPAWEANDPYPLERPESA
jgi:hypothetical protein